MASGAGTSRPLLPPLPTVLAAGLLAWATPAAPENLLFDQVAYEGTAPPDNYTAGIGRECDTSVGQYIPAHVPINVTLGPDLPALPSGGSRFSNASVVVVGGGCSNFSSSCCPLGTQCVASGNGRVRGGTCQPCMLGQTCPAGTLAGPGGKTPFDLYAGDKDTYPPAFNICPQGYICSSPWDPPYPCPAAARLNPGTRGCPRGAYLAGNTTTDGDERRPPQDDGGIAQFAGMAGAVGAKGHDYQGSFLPHWAFKNGGTRCPSGYMCRNPHTLQVSFRCRTECLISCFRVSHFPVLFGPHLFSLPQRCPAGHFCFPESAEAVPCRWYVGGSSACPVGTHRKPPVSFNLSLLVVGVVCFSLLLTFACCMAQSWKKQQQLAFIQKHSVLGGGDSLSKVHRLNTHRAMKKIIKQEKTTLKREKKDLKKAHTGVALRQRRPSIVHLAAMDRLAAVTMCAHDVAAASTESTRDPVSSDCLQQSPAAGQMLVDVAPGSGAASAAPSELSLTSTFPSRPGVSFTFENLSLDVTLADGKVKRVLNSVSGTIEAGCLTAVMGPSGAGKTTFMNVLCDRAGYGKRKGTLLINGNEDRFANHRDIMGFVPQEDTVHETLTVRENLYFAAAMRLPIPRRPLPPPQGAAHQRYDAEAPPGLPAPRARCRCGTLYPELCCRGTAAAHVGGSASGRMYYTDHVDVVLRMLQLEHIQDSQVGSVEKRGISGGQRKRVNIGLELVADPAVLFLDEPTSGLDSTSSGIIMKALKELSSLGRTIVTVIHQPRRSIFVGMHNVVLLAPGGKTCYMGGPLDACDYFEMIGFPAPPTENIADFFMDVLAGEVRCLTDKMFSHTHLPHTWRSWVEYAGKETFIMPSRKELLKKDKAVALFSGNSHADADDYDTSEEEDEEDDTLARVHEAKDKRRRGAGVLTRAEMDALFTPKDVHRFSELFLLAQDHKEENAGTFNWKKLSGNANVRSGERKHSTNADKDDQHTEVEDETISTEREAGQLLRLLRASVARAKMTTEQGMLLTVWLAKLAHQPLHTLDTSRGENPTALVQPITLGAMVSKMHRPDRATV